METENRQLTKAEVAQALCIDSKTLNRYIKKGWFPGPSVIEGSVNYWTLRQVEEFVDRAW
jgi:predicted DNA-binding transcriptional regulator AlpA